MLSSCNKVISEVLRYEKVVWERNMMQINPQCGEHRNCEHLSRTLDFSTDILFHWFSVLARKVLIILLDYILLLEILYIKCWQWAGILLPLLKRVRVHPGQAPSSSGTQPALSSFRTNWRPFSGLSWKQGFWEKRSKDIALKHSSFQNLGLIISNDTHCEFTSLFARICTGVNSKVVFLRKGLFCLSPDFNSCRSECQMK